MQIKKVATDNRGDVYAFRNGKKTHTLVTFKKNGYRGGHYHQKPQWHICISGEFEVRLHDMDSGEGSKETLHEGESLYVLPRIAHLFKAINGPAVLAESRTGEYEATDYEPYRKLARPQ